MKGVFAVRNRDTRQLPATTLDESAVSEAAFFTQALPGYDVGSDSLIRKLVQMLCQYVTSTWIPNAERRIGKQCEDIEASIKQLGDDPADKPRQLCETLLSHLGQALTRKLQDDAIQLPHGDITFVTQSNELAEARRSLAYKSKFEKSCAEFIVQVSHEKKRERKKEHKHFC